MWVVEAIHPSGNGREERCAGLTRIAGRRWDSMSSGDGTRELIWYCDTVGIARELRDALSKVGGVSVRVREPIEGK